MHDIDRAMFELENPNELALGEHQEAFESTYEVEAREMELASQLLEITNEEELEEFLGSLMRSAASGVRSFAASPTGAALGGILKGAARQVLPQVGGVIGSALGGRTGAQLGQRAGRWLGGQFETEAMSAEDRELEVARGFVRLAQDAARVAARQATSGASPQQAARSAAVAAARRSLPGLVPLIGSGQFASSGRRSGRWVRRGDRIVLIGA